jgi:hypothetical protein
MSATTLPLVAAMLLMAAILSSFCFVYFTSYNVFRYQTRNIRLAIG